MERVDVAVVAAALTDDDGLHYATSDAAVLARFSFHGMTAALSHLITFPVPITTDRCIAVAVSAVDAARLRSSWMVSNSTVCIDTTQPHASGTLVLSPEAAAEALDSASIEEEWRSEGTLRTIDGRTIAIGEVLAVDPSSGIAAAAVSFAEALSKQRLPVEDVLVNGISTPWNQSLNGFPLPWSLSRVNDIGATAASQGDHAVQWQSALLSLPPEAHDWPTLGPLGIAVTLHVWNTAGGVAVIPLGYLTFLDPSTGGVNFNTESIRVYLPSGCDESRSLHNFCPSQGPCTLRTAEVAVGSSSASTQEYWATAAFADVIWDTPLSESALLHHWSVSLRQRCDDRMHVHRSFVTSSSQLFIDFSPHHAASGSCSSPAYSIQLSAHSLHGPVITVESAEWSIDALLPEVVANASVNITIAASGMGTEYFSTHALWTSPPREVSKNEVPLVLAASTVQSSTLKLSWCGFVDNTAGSGLQSFSVAIGAAPFLTNIRPPKTVNVSGSLCLSTAFGATTYGATTEISFIDSPAPPLRHGTVLWATITAYDAAGNVAATSQPIIRVVEVPPIPGAAGLQRSTVGFSNTMGSALFADGTTVAVQADAFEIAVEWEDFIDVDGSIEEYRVSIFSATLHPSVVERHGVEGDMGLLNITVNDDEEDKVDVLDTFIAEDLPHMYGGLVSATFGVYKVDLNASALATMRFPVPEGTATVYDIQGSGSLLQRSENAFLRATVRPAVPLPFHELMLIQIVGLSTSGLMSFSWVPTPLYVDDTPPVVGQVLDGSPEEIWVPGVDASDLTSTYSEVAMPFTRDADCQPHKGVQAARHIPVVNMNAGLLLALANPLAYWPPSGSVLPSSTLITCEILKRLEDFTTRVKDMQATSSVPALQDVFVVRRSSPRFSELKHCSVVQKAASTWQAAQNGNAPALLRNLEESGDQDLLQDFDVYSVMPLIVPTLLADITRELQMEVDTTDSTVLIARWAAIVDEESGVTNVTIVFNSDDTNAARRYSVGPSSNAAQLVVFPALPIETQVWVEIQACNAAGLCSLPEPLSGSSDGVVLTCSPMFDRECEVGSDLTCLVRTSVVHGVGR